MVWLIVGMGLYRGRSITDVVTKLDLILRSQEGETLVASSIAQARKQDCSLPEYWQARLIECGSESGDYKGFITSLTSPVQYPADSLRYVYQERWSIENGYGELKQFQLSTATLLRSQKVSGIYQEI